MNRRISIRLMLENAKSQQSRQFMFFTPQKMRSVSLVCVDECGCGSHFLVVIWCLVTV